MTRACSVNKDFFKKWSYDMAYVLGFFAADGFMNKNKRGGHYIGFHITDRQILEDIRKIMGSNHKISLRGRKKDNWKDLYKLQIGSKEIFSDLIKLGFTQNKSKTLVFPSISKKCLPHFIRGYFDGDGGVYFYDLYRKDRGKRYKYLMSSFTSGSKSFLDRLYYYLKKCGISGGTLVRKERGWELKFSRKDTLALYDLMYNNNDHCSLFLSRKKKIFEKAIKELDNAVVV